jgi:hypothetical protein
MTLSVMMSRAIVTQLQKKNITWIVVDNIEITGLRFLFSEKEV